MIRKYDFDYNHMEATLTIVVDTDKFPEEHAHIFLDFFSWNDQPDLDGDIITEAVKKIAMACFRTGKHYDTEEGVIHELSDWEGYPPLDGSTGIQLTSFSGYEFHESNLTMEMKSELP